MAAAGAALPPPSSPGSPQAPPAGPWHCHCGKKNPAHRYRCRSCKVVDVARRAYKEFTGTAHRVRAASARGRRAAVGSSPIANATYRPASAADDRKVRVLVNCIANLEAAGLDTAALNAQLKVAEREQLEAMSPGHRLESARARVATQRRALEEATACTTQAELRWASAARELQEAEADLRAREAVVDVLRVVGSINTIKAGLSALQTAAAAAAMPEVFTLLEQFQSAAAAVLEASLAPELEAVPPELFDVLHAVNDMITITANMGAEQTAASAAVLPGEPFWEPFLSLLGELQSAAATAEPQTQSAAPQITEPGAAAAPIAGAAPCTPLASTVSLQELLNCTRPSTLELASVPPSGVTNDEMAPTDTEPQAVHLAKRRRKASSDTHAANNFLARYVRARRAAHASALR